MSEVDDSQSPIGWEAARGLGFKKWCGWRGSNPRPLASEANTLSTELQPHSGGCIVGAFKGAAGIIAPHFNALIPENSMSDKHQTSDTAHAEPGSSRRQKWLTVFFSFALPLLAIVAIVYDLTSSSRPTSGALYTENAVSGRIEKVGKIEFGSASHAAKTGEEVFKAQCTTCHTAGLVGAPKFGDAAAWAPRIKTGFEALLNSALKGKNAMTPQAGGAFDTLEISRAVVYMANAAGAKFEEPKAPAAAASGVKKP